MAVSVAVISVSSFVWYNMVLVHARSRGLQHTFEQAVTGSAENVAHLHV